MLHHPQLQNKDIFVDLAFANLIVEKALGSVPGFVGGLQFVQRVNQGIATSNGNASSIWPG